ncbi:hypothetical protein [Nonomuraea sp. KM90]|uniref:hypothetical protein n=1 Tax=Nonomuraea sp. KM90 TaxID=3457428 RepID=UPI003FCC9803
MIPRSSRTSVLSVAWWPLRALAALRVGADVDAATAPLLLDTAVAEVAVHEALRLNQAARYEIRSTARVS